MLKSVPMRPLYPPLLIRNRSSKPTFPKKLSFLLIPITKPMKYIIIILFFAISNFVNSQANIQDSLAVVAIYNSTNGSNWNNNTNWLTNARLYTWSGLGVPFIINRVTSIDLENNNLTGSIPSEIGKLTSLERLSMFWNNLSGPIPSELGNLINLEDLSIFHNNLSGSIPPELGNLSSLVDLYLSDNNLTGFIPSELGNLSSLEYLTLQYNNLSGPIPPEISNLSNLVSLDLGDNKLTDPIPPEIGNLSNLEHLIIDYNNLSGLIPPEIGNLTNLRLMHLSNNNLTGAIPQELGNITTLMDLRLHYNNLSGPIPPELGNLTNLKDLRLHYSNLTGPIPQELGNLSNLEKLYLYNNNLTGPIPSEIGKAKSLELLSLNNNKLTGPIPPELGNITSLRSLNLGNNNLTDTIPLELGNITSLEKLYLNNNNLTGPIPLKLGNITSLNRLELQHNKFSFGDLEPISEILNKSGVYSPQDTMKLKKKTVQGGIVLSMDAGGTQTTYQWYYDGVVISGATDSQYILPANNIVDNHHCEANNSLLPNLTLKGFLDIVPEPCFTAGNLDICLTSKEWKPVGGVQNKIEATDIISINDFLFFEGKIIIDTVELGLVAQGEFYVENIPLPGGSIGKFSLSKGAYDLKLLGSDGVITDFLNAEISEATKIFETELKLDKLQLVKTNNETGLKITCTIKVPGISGACEDGSGGDTEIQLDGLGITTAGISLDGINVKDLGMYIPKFCLKQLGIHYDSSKDILTAGASLGMPFGEIGGGFKLEEGLIDSIGWLLEASVAPFVLGTTTIGIKGFFGHISNITKPAIEVELGGIFSDILSDDLYRITASGKTVWPTYFEIAGTGHFMRPIINTLPFQLQGGISLGYNIPNSLLNVKVDGKFGTLDEKNWLLSGNGLLRVNHRTQKTTFNGYFNGMMNISPEVFVSDPPMPIPYVISAFGLPFSAETKNTIHYGNRKNFFGSLTLDHSLLGKYNLDYLIDLTLPMDDPDYFFWQASKEEATVLQIRSTTILNQINIPGNTKYTIIHIKSDVTPPISSITSPLGKEYLISSEEDRILYSEGASGLESFWTILEPEAGMWQVELDNPTQNEEVFYYNGEKTTEFEFVVEQEGNTVHVIWDPINMESTDTVYVLLNDNNLEYNGFRVAESDASAGSLSFELDNTITDCQYYLYAQLVEKMNIQQHYSDVIINNTASALASPLNFKAEYLSDTEGFNLTWDPSISDQLTGHILTVTDSDGRDSVYANIHPSQSQISLFIEDYETKSIRIESYNEDWKIGCPATIDSLYQGCFSAQTNLSESICPGQSYILGDAEYTTSGTFYNMLSSSIGCDSLVQLNLTVVDLDNSISVSDNELIAIETSTDYYQWIDCNSGEDIFGADQQSFIPSESGEYAVRIGREGCDFISDCVQVSTGINELEESGIIVFPNPASHTLHLMGMDSRKISDHAILIDIIGRSYLLPIISETINILNIQSGIYFLVLNVEGSNYKTRIVIIK